MSLIQVMLNCFLKWNWKEEYHFRRILCLFSGKMVRTLKDHNEGTWNVEKKVGKEDLKGFR